MMKFNEYNESKNIDEIDILIESISEYKITREEYDKSIYNNKEWGILNDKEKNIVSEYTDTISYSDDAYHNTYYILIDNNKVFIDLVKGEDDYYYILIEKRRGYNVIYYYKLDQLKELKIFIKNLNLYKNKMKK